ncbi:hypothetical protein ROHU_016133 [Labeo rohita]|uniref:Uncharacterized protein n=1 Tax=Labeo rohita TaxID=84645 RepID=A0A498NLA6_LABRO|nr:hypothetical protein ROHU_016133 [Labeo rohita]
MFEQVCAGMRMSDRLCADAPDGQPVCTRVASGVPRQPDWIPAEGTGRDVPRSLYGTAPTLRPVIEIPPAGPQKLTMKTRCPFAPKKLI